MEDLNKLLELSESYPKQLEEMSEEFLLKLRIILWGQAAITANKEKSKNLPAASPQQSKKRIKRLSSLNEDNEIEDKLGNPIPAAGKPSHQKSSKISNAELLAESENIVDDNNETEIEVPVAAPRTPRTASATSNQDTENATKDDAVRKSDATNLMPPPPAPATTTDDTSYKRPQRAAKIRSEKNLKEPTLKSKIRRPTSEDIKIKLEHEQRVSQLHESVLKPTAPKRDDLTKFDVESAVKTSFSSQKSDDSILLIPGKQPSIVSLISDVEDVPAHSLDDQQTSREQRKSSGSRDSEVRDVRIRIKREKVSLDKEENLKKESLPDKDVFKAPMPLVRNEKPATLEETNLSNGILSSTTNTTTTAPTKKTRNKKQFVPKPIKVERFSDVDPKQAPISSRTRNCSLSKSDNDETSSNKETKRPESIYEDAVETPPSGKSKEINNDTLSLDVVNETVNLGPAADATMNLGPVPSDATFSTNPAQTTFQVAPGQNTFDLGSNPNATVTLNKQSGSDALSDATFDVQHVSKVGKNKDDTVGQRSFETAKDSSVPNDDSLLTEDEQEKPIVTRSKAPTPSVKAKPATKPSSASKAVYKVPPRTNELFNPLVQSPVKLRVEAFENAAAAASEQSRRPLRSRKENLTPGTITTPVIGKLTAPALGRFLTPTQTSNLAPVSSAAVKKVATSASKALPTTKAFSASSLQRSNSNSSTKTLQRENSADDFRKGLHNLAEERKKQREQKHLLAAQQREAKERERAERMAKLAKEREEKRLLKKQQEQEQKKRELEEIQRKLRQQQEDEAAKIKAAKEREMLLQMKQQQLAKQKMMPPPPKITSKYTFEMLHEDDSTDDEDKVSYKRPPPPSWSRSHVRGPFMLKQEYTPAACIDSFFSVQPMTPDLKIIFPNIDARYLKRNSSVLWSTPPRYSELPKY